MELSELAQRIRRGDRDALKALISEYGVGIYKKAYAKTQDAALAREATRQTFAQLVTSLQEQTDMDGWELWLNAVARRNIDTYSAIGTDMAYMERQLDSELFGAPALPQQTLTAQQREARQFAAQQQREARALGAAGRPVGEPAAQPVSKPARQGEAPHARRQGQDDPRAHAAKKRREQKRRADVDKLFADAPKQAHPAAAIGVLIPLCLLLSWLLLGVIGSLGWLQAPDLGYQWFNAHVMELF